jgi:hypothetical protein
MVSCSSMGVLFWVPLLLKAMLAGDFGGHAAGGHGAPPPPLPPAHCGDRDQARAWRPTRPQPRCAARRTTAGGFRCSALRHVWQRGLSSRLGCGPARSGRCSRGRPTRVRRERHGVHGRPGYLL